MIASAQGNSTLHQSWRRYLARARQWLNTLRRIPVFPGDNRQALLGDKELLQLLHQAQAADRDRQRRARQRRPGEQPSVFLGRGDDFQEARAYMMGDDLSHMEWRATARSGKPHVKVYRQEQQSVLYLVVDRGSSMRFGTRKRLKLTQAVRIALLLAFDAHLANESVGLTLLEGVPGKTGESLRPRAGRLALHDLVQSLIAPAPPRDVPDDHESVSRQLAEVEMLAPPGARIVLLSDGRFVRPEDLAGFARLASNRALGIVQILDPVETDLPVLGKAQWLDLSTGAVHYADASDPGQHQRFSVQALGWQRQLDIALGQTGAQRYRCLTTDDAWEFVSTQLLHTAAVLRAL